MFIFVKLWCTISHTPLGTFKTATLAYKMYILRFSLQIKLSHNFWNILITFKNKEFKLNTPLSRILITLFCTPAFPFVQLALSRLLYFCLCLIRNIGFYVTNKQCRVPKQAKFKLRQKKKINILKKPSHDIFSHFKKDLNHG